MGNEGSTTKSTKNTKVSLISCASRFSWCSPSSLFSPPSSLIPCLLPRCRSA